jgi:Flp pilus assembly protein TadB
MNFEIWACNLIMGIAVGGIAWFGRGTYARVIDFVELDLGERLRSMRYSSARLRPLLHVWLAGAVVVFFGLWFGFDSFVFAVLAAVFLLAGPWYVVRQMSRRRREKLEDQLADAMVMFSSGVRAGLSIAQALDLLAKECPRPIREEFQQIVGEYKLGKPLERTLAEAKDRLKSENFVLFAAALLASRESGGRLNETVERISRSVLELQRLERKVLSETAQARKSAVYMAIVPVLVLAVYSQIDPENTSLLFRTLPGQLVLATVIVLNVVAYCWAVKILNPDI